MAGADADWLVLGASPLAHLLAGLLCREHGASVVLAGSGFSEWALPQGLDLSVMAATRPESWALLSALVPETLAVLERAGAADMAKEEPAMLVGEVATTVNALQHMRHVAIGFGHVVERQSDVEIGAGAVGYRFPAARRLDRRRLLPQLAGWLDGLKIRRVSPGRGALTLRRDGSARLALDGEMLVAARTVFADDAALLDQLGDADTTPLAAVPARVVLTEKARALPAPAMIYFDRGAFIGQHRDGSLVAQMIGPPDTALSRLGECLVAQGPLRRAAQADFTTIVSRDGPGVFANVRGSRAALFAGLGPAAAFFAPMLARHLAGRASAAEAAFIAARGFGRPGSRPGVADFAQPVPGAAP